MTVKVRALDSVGSVLDAAARAGGDAITVQALSFSLDDDTDATSSARADAFRDAKATAVQFAELAGRKLGPVLSISQTDVSPPVATPLMAGAAFDTMSSTPIQPGEVETAVVVEVRFAFEE